MNTKFVTVFLESPGGHPQDESRYRGLLLPAAAVGSPAPGKARYCQNWQSSCPWLHFNGTMEILEYYSSLVLNVQYNFASYFYGRCNVPILLHVKIGTKLNVE